MRSRATTSKKTTKVVPKPPPKETSKTAPKPRGTKRKTIPNDPPQKKAIKYDAISIVYDSTDPIIEHVRSFTSEQNDDSKKSDKATICDSEILDQIALEGLSGMTLSRLLLILDAIYPKLKSKNDANSQAFIWSIIINNLRPRAEGGKLSAYYIDPNGKVSDNTEAAQANENDDQVANDKAIRKPLIDKKIVLPSQTCQKSNWIGKTLVPVQCGIIMGHCTNFLTRIDISDELIAYADENEPMACLHEINNGYGIDNVYIVASQSLRNEAIYPRWADPNINIKLREYCTLELIGKFRSLGTVFPNDKTLGRYRLMLIAKNFIAQYQKTMCSPIEILLKRFEHCRPMDQSVHFTANNNTKKSNICDISDDEEDNNDRNRARSCLDPGNLRPDRSVFNMLYEKIKENHKGVTKLDIRRDMNIPKFHLRNHLKNLIAIKMICSKENSDATNEDYKFRLYRIAHKIPRLRMHHLRDGQKRRNKAGDLYKPTTGIMANWDDTDLKAKRIIGAKRSSFSLNEDLLLIISRITSLLIDPTLRLTWCVHKRLVRDMLHKELVESHDKTSDACLRRIKYLKKLPENIMAIDETTAELRDKPEVIRLLKANKPDGSDQRMERLFRQIFKIVRNHLPNMLGNNNINNNNSANNNNNNNNINVHLQQQQSISLVAAPTQFNPIDGQVIVTTGANGAPIRLFACGVSNNSSNPNREGPQMALEAANCAKSRQSSSSGPAMFVNSHADLLQNFNMIECQSLASLTGRPTRFYEKPKNVVDVKFNNASYVTMAQTLANYYTQKPKKRLMGQLLLDKFYTSFPDKMISSVLSKLNKRSLLTRKCPNEQGSLYRPRSRMSLKLNQSVRFLLNRYQSSSLMQLAQELPRQYQLNLEESNEMTSIAELTSFAATSFFGHLNLDLRIPEKIVELDRTTVPISQQPQSLQQSQRNKRQQAPSDMKDGLIVVQPCKVRFYSESEITFIDKRMEDFLNEQSCFSSLLNTAMPKAAATAASGSQQTEPSLQTRTSISTLHGSDAAAAAANSKQLNKQDSSKSSQSQAMQSNAAWTVKGFRPLLRSDVEDATPVSSDQQQQLQRHHIALAPSELDSSGNSAGTNTGSSGIVHIELEPIEFSARLWKTIDGQVHGPILIKMLESLLSWIIVQPGIESELLRKEFSHLMPEEHLEELFELMQHLELITCQEIKQRVNHLRLFGLRVAGVAASENADDDASCKIIKTYEPTPMCYIRFGQLLRYRRQESDSNSDSNSISNEEARNEDFDREEPMTFDWLVPANDAH